MLNFEWKDVRRELPQEPYDEEYMVCIKGACISTVCAFENGRFIDRTTGLHPKVEFWHPCLPPPKPSGMIIVGEARAFRGVMKVTNAGGLEERVTGDFIFSPASRKWYHGESGRKFDLADCEILEVLGWKRP